jgi:hypothetical protein
MNRVRILQILLYCALYVGKTITQQVCVPTWTVYPRQQSIGGVEQEGVSDLLECIGICEYQSGSCVALDLDTSGNTPKCWLHLNADDLTDENTYPDQDNVQQYRVNRTCFSQNTDCLVEWSRFPGQNSLNGVQFPYWLASDCFAVCRYTTDCVAVDFNEKSDGPPCWLHTSQDDLTFDNTFDDENTVQYRINRTCPAPVTTDHTLGRCAGQSFPNASWCPTGQVIRITNALYKIHPLCCFNISDNSDPPPDSSSLPQFNIYQQFDAVYIADVHGCEDKNSCQLKSKLYRSDSVNNEYCPKQQRQTNYVTLTYNCVQSGATTSTTTVSVAIPTGTTTASTVTAPNSTNVSDTTTTTTVTMGSQSSTASGTSTAANTEGSGEWLYPSPCIKNSSCIYTASWSLDPIQDVITFTIVAKQPTNTWTAFPDISIHQ